MSSLRAELAGFDAEIADAGGFEVFEVGGELGGLRGVAAAVLAQSIGFGAQRLELLLAFEQRDAQQAGFFGPARGFGDGLLAQLVKLLLLRGE